jgi:Tol biopolymer transport system component
MQHAELNFNGGLVRRLIRAGCLLLLALLPAACSIDLSEHPPTATAPTVTPARHETTIRLAGHLIFIQSHADLVQLDLPSSQTSTLFHAPDNAWLAAAAVSPDGKQIVVAYAPAPKDPLQQIAYTDLDILSADGSDAPRVLVQRTDPKEEFAFPQWSADGRFIYYAHTIPATTGLVVQYTYTIERVAYPQGQPQKLIENAIWPRLSPDGKKLAYVSFNPQTGDNNLYVADADGTHAQLVVPAGTFYTVDAPLFSRDSQVVVFSAVGGPASSQRWSDQFISTMRPNALKHNIPSDWWRVDLATGKIKSLTRIGDTGLYGDFSPDGQHIAFVAVTGLYLMNPDGSNLTQIMNYGPEGTVSWIP